jgi:hypothetical protein
MKASLYFFCFSFLLSSSCSAQNSNTGKIKANDPAKLFTLSEAERILGEQGHIKDSTLEGEYSVLKYSSSYFANAMDPRTGKTGAIYYVYEDYPEVKDAMKSYSFIRTGNEKNGINVLDDLGDEAYFHTDKQNFYFILVRKGTKMFRMKVNKITGNTSLAAFNAVAKEITSKL